MGWLKSIFGSSGSEQQATARRGTVKNPLVVQSPKIGYFNLLGASGQSIIDEDQKVLNRLFPSFEESSAAPPTCNVLMIYAKINEDGSVIGSIDGLRGIIRRSGAEVVVVASDNDPKAYFAAAKRTGYGQANLVMTLQRKGSAFPTFFVQLFEKMCKGTTMPVAWVQLAPQIPGMTHSGPESIFAAEISHIVFRQ
jgi:hypothetical protein